MTQEEKQLLMKDLSTRLPYGVNGLITVHRTVNENSTFNGVIDGKIYDRFANLQDSWYDNIPSIKPYLRPLSSMTAEERMEYDKLIVKCIYDTEAYFFDNYNRLNDWLNEHHFDYRGLIEKGLALEAPEGMYKIE